MMRHKKCFCVYLYSLFLISLCISSNQFVFGVYIRVLCFHLLLSVRITLFPFILLFHFSTVVVVFGARICQSMKRSRTEPRAEKNVHKTLSYWKIMLRKRESHKNCLRSARMCFRLCSRERSMNVGAKQQQKIHKNAGVFTAVSSSPHTASKNFSTSHIDMKGRKGERGRKCCERIKT